MSDEPPPGVLGGLPRSRPHRRSDKRPAALPSQSEPVAPVPPAPVTPAAKRAPKPRATSRAKPKPGPAAKTTGSAKPAPKLASGGAKAAPKRAPGHGKAATAGPSSRAAATRPAPSPSVAPRVQRTREDAGNGATPLGTAVQAAAELAEIGLKASARALRGALSRLPRP